VICLIPFLRGREESVEDETPAARPAAVPVAAAD
jgi:hypothetical protein